MFLIFFCVALWISASAQNVYVYALSSETVFYSSSRLFAPKREILNFDKIFESVEFDVVKNYSNHKVEQRMAIQVAKCTNVIKSKRKKNIMSSLESYTFFKLHKLNNKTVCTTNRVCTPVRASVDS